MQKLLLVLFVASLCLVVSGQYGRSYDSHNDKTEIKHTWSDKKDDYGKGGYGKSDGYGYGKQQEGHSTRYFQMDSNKGYGRKYDDNSYKAMDSYKSYDDRSDNYKKYDSYKMDDYNNDNKKYANNYRMDSYKSYGSDNNNYKSYGSDNNNYKSYGSDNNNYKSYGSYENLKSYGSDDNSYKSYGDDRKYGNSKDGWYGGY
ncbi:uncharacterized protein LOC128962422 [Oppia nitens]|uniref:uncharacterized protein LOC128962422 n=1 Tax=Oppia nitens TaxID=1686743 RepID=UPI0023DA1D0E|nr:uncharacterized protein LOC128962422 [Oppia nitens]